MATQAIPREEWTTFFDQFSVDHQGVGATLEVHSVELGDQVIAYEQIFRGISADQKDGENRIAIMMDAGNDDGTSHSVPAPERVWLNDTQGTGGETIEINSADNVTTLLHF